MISDYIEKYLSGFIGEPNLLFDKIFEEINNQLKIKNKNLLKYIFKLLDELQKNENDSLTATNIHFEYEIAYDIKILILEFIWNYFFWVNYENENSEIESKTLIDEIEALKRKIYYRSLPEKLTSLQFKKLNIQNKIYKTHLEYFSKFKKNATLNPSTLVNFLTFYKADLLEHFINTPTSIDLENKSSLNSYVLINVNPYDKLKKMKYKNEALLKKISTVVLFDCESSIKRFRDFNYQKLKDLNENNGTNFRNLIFITFESKQGGIHKITTKMNLMRDRFRIPANSTYIIVENEYKLISNLKIDYPPNPTFLGSENSTFWDSFLADVQIREDLYELRSIKLKNIFSLCLNEEIKVLILESIFSNNAKLKVINERTKQALEEMSEEEIIDLKQNLSYTLDSIINLNLKNEILKQIDKDTKVVVDNNLLTSDLEILRLKLLETLNFIKPEGMISWSSINNSIDDQLFFLSYRDQGNSYYHFYPNLIESTFPNCRKKTSLLISFLFKRDYFYSKYFLYKNYHDYQNHIIRKKHFDWNILHSEIDKLKQTYERNISYDLEADLSHVDHRETFKIKLNQKLKTCIASDLFIYKIESDVTRRVIKLSELYPISKQDEQIYCQNLDEIQEKINLFEKIINTNQQEEELKIIREQSRLGNVDAASIWKLLLRRKTEFLNEKELYKELKNSLEKENLRIVSFHYFKKIWLDPKSESFAPINKRVFKSLCIFLGLPKTYFFIIQRKRNASKQSSRLSTRYMNNLLKDLFNDGCFDDDAIPKKILNENITKYKIDHPLDELGIDEDHLIDDLDALVEIIKPELNLSKLEFLEENAHE